MTRQRLLWSVLELQWGNSNPRKSKLAVIASTIHLESLCFMTDRTAFSAVTEATKEPVKLPKGGESLQVAF